MDKLNVVTVARAVRLALMRSRAREGHMRMYYFIVVVLQLAHPRSRTRGVPMVKINVLNRARVVLLVLPRFLVTLVYHLAVGDAKLPKSDVPNGRSRSSPCPMAAQGLRRSSWPPWQHFRAPQSGA